MDLDGSAIAQALMEALLVVEGERAPKPCLQALQRGAVMEVDVLLLEGALAALSRPIAG